MPQLFFREDFFKKFPRTDYVVEAHAIWQLLLCCVRCCQKLPRCKKAPNITTFVPLLLYVRKNSAEQFQGTSLVGRQIGIKLEDTHQISGP